MGDVLNQLVEYWYQHDSKPSEQKATVADVTGWEDRYSVRLPNDLREYVMRVNGSRQGEQLEFGDDLISFLPLGAMVPEAEWTKHESKSGLFVFADYLISSYWWCIELTKQPAQLSRVYVRGSALKLVASSLHEFFSAYMENATRIHP
jgi:hypothetical protein